MAFAERFRRLGTFSGERRPVKSSESVRTLRKQFEATAQAIQKGRIDAARLIREVDGEGQCTVFSAMGQIKLDKTAAYGLLDSIGRMAEHHSEPVQLDSTLRVFTHPNVFTHFRDVVFDAVEKNNADGKREFVEVWLKRREPFHDALLARKAEPQQAIAAVPKFNPAETLDVKLGVY